MDKSLKRDTPVSDCEPVIFVIMTSNSYLPDRTPEMGYARFIRYEPVVLKNTGRRTFHLNDKDTFRRFIDKSLAYRRQIDGVDKIEMEPGALFEWQAD